MKRGWRTETTIATLLVFLLIPVFGLFGFIGMNESKTFWWVLLAAFLVGIAFAVAGICHGSVASRIASGMCLFVLTVPVAVMINSPRILDLLGLK